MGLGPSLTGQTLTWEERVWSNSPQVFVCIPSSRAPNEVGVNINWDAFCKGRSSVFLNSMPKKATLGVFETRWEFDRTLSPHESLARETSLDQTRLN